MFRERSTSSLNEWLFWSFLSLILYTYFGYPALLFLISSFRKRPVKKEDITPSVSIIIAVHNEEKNIKKKIENTLSLDYPREKLEIIIVSDCSTDSTDQIVRQFEKDGVRFFSLKERKGKHYAQAEGIDQARGEILAFTDAAAMLEKNALLNLAKNFADPKVGCVTSEDRILSQKGVKKEEGTYVKFEMMLRRLESQCHSLVGLSGSFFAVRKRLGQKWPLKYSSDFILALRSVTLGYRAVNDSTSIHYYSAVPSSKGEFRRKVRTIGLGLTILFRHLEVLNVFHFGFFSFEIFSHKLCRWLVPFFLLLVFLTDLSLVNKSQFYLYFLIAQILFYSMAGLAFLFPSLNKIRIFAIPSFFCLVNFSILVAWFQTIGGKKHFVWEPSQRE
jgi:cellulose synthase/poly-beta-1,6-N-acetylglucosamine synthase-like glycosyltransferase